MWDVCLDESKRKEKERKEKKNQEKRIGDERRELGEDLPFRICSTYTWGKCTPSPAAVSGGDL